MSADEEKPAESALRENIGKKGRNSYYYAHSKTATGPEWDGKEEPKLLSVEKVETGKETEKVVVAELITNYAWCK